MTKYILHIYTHPLFVSAEHQVETTQPSMTATAPRGRKLCFEPALLENEAFDVQNFVASIRSKVSLSVLRDDLRTNVESIQAELVSSVQHDLHAFVSLGPSITEVEPLATAAIELPIAARCHK